MAERWERSSTPGARSVAWSRSAVPEEMDLVIKRGTKPGDMHPHESIRRPRPLCWRDQTG